jgi:equilibrative nucleoside transporter 1/2/3
MANFSTMMALSFYCLIADPVYIRTFYRYASNDPHAAPRHPRLWDNMLGLMTIVRMGTNLLGQLFMLTPAPRAWNIYTRLVASEMILLGAMLIVPGITVVGVADEGVAAALLLGGVAASGIAAAVGQSSGFALAAQFPAAFPQAMLIGMSAAAFLSSVIKVATKAVFAYDGAGEGSSFRAHMVEAWVYFGITVSWFAASSVSVVLLRRNAFALHHAPELAGGTAPLPVAAMAAERPVAVDDDDGAAVLNRETQPLIDAKRTAGEVGATAEETVSVVLVARMIWKPLVTVGVVVGSTWIVFPGLAADIRPHDAWFNIGIVGGYNAGLLAGRVGAARLVARIPAWSHVPGAALRLLLFPVFFFSVRPRIITGWAVPIAAMFLVSFSSGVLSGCLVAAAVGTPGLTRRSKAVASSMMSVLLLLGCTLGGLVGLALTMWYV